MLHFCQNSFHLLIQNTFSIQLINDRNIAKFNETKTWVIQDAFGFVSCKHK